MREERAECGEGVAQPLLQHHLIVDILLDVRGVGAIWGLWTTG